MEYEEFIKEASRYSKKSILIILTNHCFIDRSSVLREIKWNDIQLRFNKLMTQSNEIGKMVSSLLRKKDIESRIECAKLMVKDDEIQKKINKALKEMDTFNGVISEKGCKAKSGI